MDDVCRIFVDQLRGGKTQEIDCNLPPEIMAVEEKELAFQKEVSVSGAAYLAEDALILHLDLNTEATIPCTICNEPVQVPIFIKGAYHVIPIAEIKGRIFDFTPFVRDSILLETPAFAECRGGECPNRAEIKQYIKDVKESSDDESDGYRPFADLK